MIDRIGSISAGQGRRAATPSGNGNKSNGSRPIAPEAAVVDRVSISSNGRKAAGGVRNSEELTAEEKQQVNELKKRDAEVKAHEQAHMAAGGGLVRGGASYQYEMGPDGKRYAVGGEVQIDVSPERTPEATIRKMQQVKAAAMAPAQPSGTDRAVAARAGQIEAKARAEKTRQEQEKLASENEDGKTAVATGGEKPGEQNPAAETTGPDDGNTPGRPGLSGTQRMPRINTRSIGSTISMMA